MRALAEGVMGVQNFVSKRMSIATWADEQMMMCDWERVWGKAKTKVMGPGQTEGAPCAASWRGGP